jgi:hypothetical protein
LVRAISFGTCVPVLDVAGGTKTIGFPRESFQLLLKNAAD